MKYENDHTFTASGTMTGEKIALSFDDGARQHLMDQLTELYSDPQKACVREYTTNAYDAHVEAGQTRPIEVSTPTPLNPSSLKIRDFGLGLDAEAVREVYSKYGASTKRESNDYNGMLGFGCKAALAYADSFTVSSVKDGMRTQILCARDEDGTASMTVLYEGPSSDPSGTEVAIPAQSDNDFERIARDFFSDWPEGSVLLNGAPVAPREGERVDDTFLIVKYDRYSRRDGGNQIVMGNVAYPVENLETDLSYGYAVVAHVPIGTVSIAPSREALKYTARTKAAVSDLRLRFSQATQGFIEKKVSEAANGWDALTKLYEVGAMFGRSFYRTPGITWHGQTMPRQVPLPKGYNVATDAGSHVLSRHDKNVTEVPSQMADQAVFFVGYDKPSFTPTHKKKLNQWAAKHGVDARNYYLLEATTLRSTWIDPAKVFQWSDVNAEVLPRAPKSATGPSGKPQGSFNIRTETGTQWDVLASDFNAKKPIYYYVGRLSGACHHEFIAASLAPKGYTLVMMGANREAKFRRDFPAAKEIQALAGDAFKAWSDSLTEDQKASLWQNEHDGMNRVYARMDADRVTDPALQRAIRLAHVSADLMNAYRRFAYLGFRLELPDTAPKRLLDKYSLFDTSKLRTYPDETYAYMNWVHGA